MLQIQIFSTFWVTVYAADEEQKQRLLDVVVAVDLRCDGTSELLLKVLLVDGPQLLLRDLL